jgi:AcrR family transcriptional regulator
LRLVSRELPRLEWVRPPQQKRSHETMARILDAAEVLVAQRGFERASVAEICERAESSVGAFYARFPDKEALRRQLQQRFLDEGLATIDATLIPTRWDGVSLADFLRTGARFLASIFRERRELLAALAQPGAGTDGPPSFAHVAVDHLADRAHALLVHRGTRVAHPKPREAIRFLTWLVLSAFEGQARRREPEPMPVDQIAEHIAQMILTYLGIQE